MKSNPQSAILSILDTIVNTSLEFPKDCDGAAHLNLEVYPRCDGGFKTKIQFWCVSSEQIQGLIDNLSVLRDDLKAFERLSN